jgi:hypothetical protein
MQPMSQTARTRCLSTVQMTDRMYVMQYGGTVERIAYDRQ